MPIKHLAWLHRLHYYWCGGMRLLNAFNPNSDQANRGNGESLGSYLAITGDWTSYYDPFASQTCINPPEPSHSQPSAKPSVQAAVGKKSILISGVFEHREQPPERDLYACGSKPQIPMPGTLCGARLLSTLEATAHHVSI